MSADDRRQQACIHDSGCDGRSHSLACNNLYYAHAGVTS